MEMLCAKMSYNSVALLGVYVYWGSCANVERQIVGVTQVMSQLSQR